jgi:3-oxoacyl-[acyl-carrier-protein] synthase II
MFFIVASHITTPSDDGDGAQRCMKMAMNDAGISEDDIDYINAHSTSTPTGDRVEIAAINNLFKGRNENGKKLLVSSTKVTFNIFIFISQNQ